MKHFWPLCKFNSSGSFIGHLRLKHLFKENFHGHFGCSETHLSLADEQASMMFDF